MLEKKKKAEETEENETPDVDEKKVKRAKVVHNVAKGLNKVGLLGNYGERVKEKTGEHLADVKGKPSRESIIKALALLAQAMISGKNKDTKDPMSISEVKNAIKLIAKEQGVEEDEVDLKSFKYK